MNDPQKSAVASTTLISVFVLGLVLGLFIGIFGGPLIERYFNKPAPLNAPTIQRDANAPRDEGGGRIINPAPSESKPSDAKPETKVGA
jgi:hypothetical protein